MDGDVCEMAVMDGTGDTKHIWNPQNDGEVAAARAVYDSLRSKGYKAYRVDERNGEKTGEPMRQFDPTVGKMIMVPQLVGG